MISTEERMLRHGACADPYHDFSHPPASVSSRSMFNTNASYKAGQPGLFEAKIGLPGKIPIPVSKSAGDPNALHDENQMLQLLFNEKEIGTYKVPSEETVSEASLMSNIFSAIDNIEGEQATVNFETLSGTKGYTIRLLKDSTGNTNVNATRFKAARKETRRKSGTIRPARPQSDGTLITSDLIKFIGGVNEINLLFDACSVDVISLFRYGKKDKETLNVNWLINREFINDPATKPYKATTETITDKLDRNNIHFLVEDVQETITYPVYTEVKDDLLRNKFYSLYDFKLAATKMPTADSLPTTQLEIFDNKRNVHKSADPKSDNQIGACCRRILDYIIMKVFGRTNMIAVNYQAKRSGDWLQGLSCLDVLRKYRPVGKSESKELKIKNIVLVTHDRILLFYSILLGLDVIFVGGSGTENTGGEYDDDEIGVAAAGAGAGAGAGAAAAEPNLFIAYFSNDARQMTPKQIDAYKQGLINSITTPISGESKINILLENIVAFNSKLKELESTRLTTIGSIYKAIQVKASGKLKPLEKIKDLLMEFVRYGSLDYTPIDREPVEAALEKYTRSPNLVDGIELYSLYNTFEIKVRQIESLETSGTYAKNAEMFAGPLPTLYTNRKEIARRAVSSSKEASNREWQNMEKLSIGICDVVPQELLKLLKTYIEEGIQGAIKAQETVDFLKTPIFTLLNHIYLRLEPSKLKLDNDTIQNLNELAKEQLEQLSFVTEADSEDLELPKSHEDAAPISKRRCVGLALGAAEAAAGADTVAGVDGVSNATSLDEKKIKAMKRLTNLKEDSTKGEVDDIIKPVIDSEKEAKKKVLEGLISEKEINSINENILTNPERIFITCKNEFEEAKEEYLTNVSDEGKEKILKISEAIYDYVQISVNLDEKELDVEADTAPVLVPAAAGAGSTAANSAKKSVFGKIGSGIRKGLRNFFSVLPTRRLIASMVSREEARAGAGAAKSGPTTRSAKRGGGNIQDVWAHFLFISYICEILSALNGFESADNLDYKYYDGLSRLVLAYVQSLEDTTDFKPMIQFLYNVLPTCDWKLRGDFEFYTSYVAHCTALNAVNRISGDLPDFGYIAPLTETTIENYEKLTDSMRGKKFHERQYFLQYNLWHLMNLPFESGIELPPQTQEIVTTVGNSVQNKGFNFHLNFNQIKRNSRKNQKNQKNQQNQTNQNQKNQINNMISSMTSEQYNYIVEHPEQFQNMFSTLTPQQIALLQNKIRSFDVAPRPPSLLNTERQMLGTAVAGGKRKTFKKRHGRNKTRKNRG